MTYRRSKPERGAVHRSSDVAQSPQANHPSITLATSMFTTRVDFSHESEQNSRNAQTPRIAGNKPRFSFSAVSICPPTSPSTTPNTPPRQTKSALQSATGPQYCHGGPASHLNQPLPQIRETETCFEPLSTETHSTISRWPITGV